MIFNSFILVIFKNKKRERDRLTNQKLDILILENV